MLGSRSQGRFNRFLEGELHADPSIVCSPAPRRIARGVHRACRPRREDTIKIGELNSYKVVPGLPRALQEGLGAGASRRSTPRAACSASKLEVVRRDDNGNPGDAVRVAEELLSREKVAVPDRHLPVERRARRRRLRQAAQDAVHRRRAADRQDRLGRTATPTPSACGPRPTCRPRCSCPRRPSWKRKRWAIVYPNYEYGQRSTAAFKALLLKVPSAGRRIRDRTSHAAWQDRCWRGGPGDRRCQARCGVLRRLGRRSRAVRARRQRRAACSRTRLVVQPARRASRNISIR